MNSHYQVVNGLGIALGLFAATIMAVSSTGAALNPTIGIVQTALSDVFDRQFHLTSSAPKSSDIGYDAMWIYIIGPAIGGILAGLFYKLVHETRGKVRYDGAADVLGA